MMKKFLNKLSLVHNANIYIYGANRAWSLYPIDKLEFISNIAGRANLKLS